MNPSTALATVVVDELVRHGVREAVLCPGSRSAPFAYALQEADRAGRLRLHVRVDERSAAFLALGMAKLTRRPVPVFTTSGTAVANLHPAVLEASHAAVPLIIVSADRPPELRGTGANQTTDQGHLFGTAPSACSTSSAHQRAARARTRYGGRSWVGSTRQPSGRAGRTPVRSISTFPSVSRWCPIWCPPPDGEWPESLEGRDDAAPWVRVQPARRQGEPFASIPRTLVLLGDLPDPAMAVEVTGSPGLRGGRSSPSRSVPTTAAPWSRTVPCCSPPVNGWAASALIGSWSSGGSRCHAPVGALLRNPAVTVEIVAAQSNWPDPSHVASVVHPFEAVTASIPNGRQVDEQWAREWADAGELVAKAAGVDHRAGVAERACHRSDGPGRTALRGNAVRGLLQLGP